VLPPLPKLPKLKKIRQWNGGSLLSLNQFPHLPAAFNLGSGIPPTTATTAAAPATHRPVLPPRTDFHRPVPHHPQHMRHSSDISIISATVSSRTPADYSHRDNLGLYALKCDRSAAKRGILLNLPRKITQAVGVGGGPTEMMMGQQHQQHGASAMVHEKFSPCKRHPPPDDERTQRVPEIRPPPRRRKRPPPAAMLAGTRQQPPCPQPDLSQWQKNSSELFRIVERESASAARARSAGGVGLPRAKKPLREAPDRRTFLDTQQTSSSDGVVELVQQTRAQSVDNLLAVRYHRRRRGAFAEPERTRDESDESESSGRQVQSLRLHQPTHHHRRTSSAATAEINTTIVQPRQTRAPLRNIQLVPTGSVSSSLPVVQHGSSERAPFPLDRACDFSIDNNSDEIEVRFRKGYSTDESSDATTTVAIVQQGEETAPRPAKKPVEKLPLPPRVVQLRRTDPGPAVNRGKSAVVPVAVPKHEPETVPDATALPAAPPPPVPSSATDRPFMPLAEVLRKSIDSAELKRKWLNDFLSQGSESQQPVDGGRTVSEMELDDAFVPQLDLVQRIDRQLEELESGATLPFRRQDSVGSVDIFRKPACDFDEFDELFTEPMAQQQQQQQDGRKTVKLSEQIAFIERNSTTSNLCFSSSSFSCASLEDGGKHSLPPTAPPPPPPPPPPSASFGRSEGKEQAPIHRSEPAGSGCRSTVKIQDYGSSKHQHLQRVRYLSSPSPSRSSMVVQPMDADLGESVETIDHSETTHRRKGNNTTMLPLLNSGSSCNVTEVGKEPAKRHVVATTTLPEPENRSQPLGHWAALGWQADQHRLSTSTSAVNNNSVLPDYSEYYNEEGVIII
uniref:Uncharacterized protein n=1 Tax=Anopheles christyi TaxID=43041 RepID=A0A182KH23_9DIPT